MITINKCNCYENLITMNRLNIKLMNHHSIAFVFYFIFQKKRFRDFVKIVIIKF